MWLCVRERERERESSCLKAKLQSHSLGFGRECTAFKTSYYFLDFFFSFLLEFPFPRGLRVCVCVCVCACVCACVCVGRGGRGLRLARWAEARRRWSWDLVRTLWCSWKSSRARHTGCTPPPIVLPSLHLSLSLSLLLSFFLFLSFPSPFYEVSGYTCLIAFVFVCKNSLPPILHVYPNFPLSLSLSGVFFLLGHSLLLPLLAAPEAKAYRDRTP